MKKKEMLHKEGTTGDWGDWVERVSEKLIKQQVDINEMQFGFLPGCGATDVIFIFRQLQEKCLAK